MVLFVDRRRFWRALFVIFPPRQRGRRAAYLVPTAGFVRTTDTSVDNYRSAVVGCPSQLAENAHAPRFLLLPSVVGSADPFACQRDPRNFWVVPSQAKEVRTNHWPSLRVEHCVEGGRSVGTFPAGVSSTTRQYVQRRWQEEVPRLRRRCSFFEDQSRRVVQIFRDRGDSTLDGRRRPNNSGGCREVASKAWMYIHTSVLVVCMSSGRIDFVRSS